jgi:DNA-binding LacI/PurR family transcriptional regulator
MFTPQLVKPATSADVAAVAGVSRATVSLVLNDRSTARISDDTRLRVREAARQLGYVPNTAARSLKSPLTDGWVFAGDPAQTDGSLASALELAGSALSDDGEDVYWDTRSASRGAVAAMSWARARPAAVIAGADRCDSEATDLLRLSGVRALLVYGEHKVDYAPTLVVPHYEYGHLAVEHLAGRGHRSIAVVVPAGSTSDEAGRLRLAGARDAAAGRVVVSEVGADLSSGSLRDWAYGWRYAVNRPTAVFAHDDRYAHAALRALHDAGLRCPADLSVLGAGDFSFSGDNVPAISSLALAPDTLAQSILEAFRRMLAGEHTELVPTPTPHVVERETIARVA